MLSSSEMLLDMMRIRTLKEVNFNTVEPPL